MNKETVKRPQRGGKRMFAQVQTSVEIISPVPENGKCGGKTSMERQKKIYRNSYLRKPGIKAREGKQAYISGKNHGRIFRIVNALGDGRLTIADYLENVLNEHFRLHREEIMSMLDEAPVVEL